MFPENFITADRVHCNNTARSKKRILEELAGLLAKSNPGLTPLAVFERLLERERLGSTGLGQGIALPHARMTCVTEASGALIKLQSSTDFDAIDQQPIDLVFGLLVPEEATQEHLQILAQLATLFSDGAFCQQLRKSEDGQSLLREFLNQAPRQQSA